MDASSPSRGLAHRLEDLSPAGTFWVGSASTVMVLMAVITLMGWFAAPSSSDLRWRTGSALVGEAPWSAVVESADAQASGQVPLWFDGFGFAHDSGWPSCLEPAGATVTIRFALEPAMAQSPDEAELGDSGYRGPRAIVAVDCRQP